MPFSLQNSFLAKRMLISRKLFHRREIGGKRGFFANSPAVTKGLTWFLILLKSKMAAIVGDFTALQQRHHPQIYIILLRRSKAFHPGGVLPYMGYIGMCRCEGYGFQTVYSGIGYINQSVWI